VKIYVIGLGRDQVDVMFGLCCYVMNIQVYLEDAVYCGVSSSLCFKVLLYVHLLGLEVLENVWNCMLDDILLQPRRLESS